MTEFQRYILENHPDPDSLLEIGDKFEQMCRLAEGYAQHQVKKLNIDDVNNCPACDSENLHQYRLHHIHCKDCKEQFDKSCC